jgi:fructokinase
VHLDVVHLLAARVARRRVRGHVREALVAALERELAFGRELELEADRAEARDLVGMARALAVLINVLDPDVIVLGGGLSKVSRLYENVPRLWGAYVFSDQVATRLVPPAHGDSSGVRGAAWLWAPGEWDGMAAVS